MGMPFAEIIQEAKSLPLVPLQSISAYHENMPILIDEQNDLMTVEQDIAPLIGNNPLQMMYDNHKHHASFMMAVFSIGSYELLARTIPWVYRAYSSHNFSFDYFPLELKTWIKVLDKYIDPALTEEIKTVYQWMIKRHEDMILVSQQEKSLTLDISEDWLEAISAFQTSLIEGDQQKCLQIANNQVKTKKDLGKFYLQIIQPAMYEVGMLWERGIISVAQEHLASAIVSRIMATLSLNLVDADYNKGKVIITSAPNEFHEIGATILSDILESEGWQTHYLGSNTPKSDLLDMMRQFQPDCLMISVTMPFNIPKAREIISTMKQDQGLQKIKVMIGGRTFNEIADLWQKTGADGFAVNADEARQLLEEWSTNGL